MHAVNAISPTLQAQLQQSYIPATTIQNSPLTNGFGQQVGTTPLSINQLLLQQLVAQQLQVSVYDCILFILLVLNTYFDCLFFDYVQLSNPNLNTATILAAHQQKQLLNQLQKQAFSVAASNSIPDQLKSKQLPVLNVAAPTGGTQINVPTTNVATLINPTGNLSTTWPVNVVRANTPVAANPSTQRQIASVAAILAAAQQQGNISTSQSVISPQTPTTNIVQDVSLWNFLKFKLIAYVCLLMNILFLLSNAVINTVFFTFTF